MPQNLITDITVTLAADAESTVAHNLVGADGTALLPFEVRPDRGTPIVVTATTTTTVSFRNDGDVEATAIFRAWRYHSEMAPGATTSLKWAGTLAGGSGSGLIVQFTYAPSAVTNTAEGLYATFAPLYTAIQALEPDIKKVIYCPEDYATIPTLGVGVGYDFRNVAFEAPYDGQDDQNVLEFEEGATVAYWPTCESRNISWYTNSSIPVYTGLLFFAEFYNCRLSAGTANMFRFTGAPFTYPGEFILRGYSYLENQGAAVVWQDTTDDTFRVTMYDRSFLQSDSLKSTASTHTEVILMQSDKFNATDTYIATHAEVLGTLDLVPYVTIERMKGTTTTDATGTYADIASLTLPLDATEKYWFEAWVIWSTSVITTGIGLTVNYTGTTTGSGLMYQTNIPITAVAGTDTIQVQQSIANAATTDTTDVDSTNNHLAIISGMIQTNSAGTLSIQGRRENASGAGTVSFKLMSFLRLDRISPHST